MAIPLSNLSIAFQELGRDVDVALRTQIGDAARLGEQKRLCLQFYGDLHQHSHLLSPEDYQSVQQSLNNMLSPLEQATTSSIDSPDAPPPLLGGTIADGHPGCPRIDIKPEDLASLTSGRVTHQQIADLYGCSACTIRCRLAEYGISQPGPPVYTQQEQPDGSVLCEYTPGVSADLSNLSDDELDRKLLDMYKQFPSLGRRMIDGYLLHLGERVARQRIINSYHRVIGPTTATFGTHHIQRYGFLRLLLGVRASNNNRADMVLKLFEDITAVFGYPSCVQGDHGIENLLVAARMEEVRGQDCGSYIWGRSVHNIRIKRLWVDVTRGVGKKWKDFFCHLKVHDGLNADLDAHIWLLHYLFLDAINVDLTMWANIWNNHDFGVDWNEVENPETCRHHDANNMNDGDPMNPFLPHQPDTMSHIEVPDTQCPFMLDELAIFEAHISALPTLDSMDMHSRCLLWCQALDIATGMLDEE
ncbi:hypothetical protein DXG01_016286 [Tephrocybe rancida]|nr:hypothetical protein DXG01_016286 [Tephrocybe rancida]